MKKKMLRAKIRDIEKRDRDRNRERQREMVSLLLKCGLFQQAVPALSSRSFPRRRTAARVQIVPTGSYNRRSRLIDFNISNFAFEPYKKIWAYDDNPEDWRAAEKKNC